jgi:hypothetical protein
MPNGFCCPCVWGVVVFAFFFIQFMPSMEESMEASFPDLLCFFALVIIDTHCSPSNMRKYRFARHGIIIV